MALLWLNGSRGTRFHRRGGCGCRTGPDGPWQAGWPRRVVVVWAAGCRRTACNKLFFATIRWDHPRLNAWGRNFLIGWEILCAQPDSVPRPPSALGKSAKSTVLRGRYRRLPPRSASDSGGTPWGSWGVTLKRAAHDAPGRRSQSTSSHHGLVDIRHQADRGFQLGLFGGRVEAAGTSLWTTAVVWARR